MALSLATWRPLRTLRCVAWPGLGKQPVRFRLLRTRGKQPISAPHSAARGMGCRGQDAGDLLCFSREKQLHFPQGRMALAQEGKVNDADLLLLSVENEGNPNPTPKSSPLLPTFPPQVLLLAVTFFSLSG